MKVIIDAVGLSAALWLSYLLRFDGIPDLQFIKQLIVLWPYMIACQLGFLLITGVSAYSWRYIGLRECQRIVVVFALPSALFLCIRLGAPLLESVLPHAAYLKIPIGVICIDLCLGLAMVIGVRVLRRIVGERYEISQRMRGFTDRADRRGRGRTLDRSGD